MKVKEKFKLKFFMKSRIKYLNLKKKKKGFIKGYSLKTKNYNRWK